MEESNRSLRGVRFGVFEVDLRSGELRKQGLKIKLQGQPIQILALLLERPGELVTREELKEKLWPKDTFVDFEHGLNAAIKKLRAALGDSADSPRFVETLHRRGYRFIASVEGLGQAPPAQVAAGVPATPVPRARFLPAWLAALAVVALLAVLFGLNVGGWREWLLGGPTPGQITSLVVLPLNNMMGDTEQDYFVEGMHEALITELSKIGALKVISRTSAMRYKDTDKSVPEIARELGVDAVIEGSVLRAGSTVRVTAQLIEAATDKHLWADSYQRELRDVLSLQSEVAQAIASEIQITVTPEEQVRLARARPVNPKAYEAYQRGRHHWNKHTESDLRKAVEYYDEAIGQDPGFAPAYAGLALAYSALGGTGMGVVPSSAALPRARAAATRALELNDMLADAHVAQGHILTEYVWDWKAAEEEFKRAIKLNPNHATAHHLYAGLLSRIGRHEEAITRIRQAQKLDPLSPIINIAAVFRYWLAGQDDEALAESQSAIVMHSDNWLLHMPIGYIHLRNGRHEEAITEFQKVVTLRGGDRSHISSLAYAYGVAGEREKALGIFAELEKRSTQTNVRPFGLAVVAAGLRDNDLALDWLEKGVESHDPSTTWLKVFPAFDHLRADPRFQSLLRRMKFPD